MNKLPGIVVCEDELIVALDLKVFLKKNGYNVPAIFTSAEEAIEFINKDKPVLIISSIKLRGSMNGINLAETMEKNYRIPVLLISGEMINQEDSEIIRLDCHFMKKPFSHKELSDKISAILTDRK